MRERIRAIVGLVVLCTTAAHSSAGEGGLGPRLRFEPPPATAAVFDTLDLVIHVKRPDAPNPFRDLVVTAELQTDGAPPRAVEGFCDAQNGSVYRVHFMPLRPGPHRYVVRVSQGGETVEHAGAFDALPAPQRDGPVRVDPEHPWHFIHEGSGRHYYWNGTTTYFLLGWQDESIIRQSLDRLAELGITRVRVALNGRTRGGERWDEHQVVNTDAFRFRLNPWIAARPDDPENPGLDTTRFNVPFWQKCERLLRHARDRGIVVSLIFHLDGRDPGVDPFGPERAGGDDEQRYYRYAVARLAAFPNIMWDVTNEWHLFRTEEQVNRMGTLLAEADPYGNLISVHGSGTFPYRRSPWADFALFQSWDDWGGHAFMLRNRQEQAATGRPIPQANEEYGYEDHYPTRWGGGRRYPSRSADNRRRLAWGMVMAGGYQTTGERADRGEGRSPGSGGGWLTGRGDPTMTMLAGYRHLKDCITALEWWRMDPDDDRVVAGRGWCLAEPGRQYLAYLPAGGAVTLKLEPGPPLQARWFNPRNGDTAAIGPVQAGGTWSSPPAPDRGDWALLLTTAMDQ